MKKGWFIALVVLTIVGCGQKDVPPVVFVGIDGAEWQVIDEMIADRELPNFARIKREGAWGHLINNGMTISPVVWTTFATGHFARQHGVLDHVYPYHGEGARRPVTSELRQVPALWNIATHYGLRSVVVGYFVSHPPEPIDGVIVSSQAPTGVEGSIYPENALPLETPRYKLLRNPDGRSSLWAPFFGWDYDPAQADDPESPYQVAAATVVERQLHRRIVRDEYIRRAVSDLAVEHSDLFIAYYRIPDLLSHSLWRFFDPDVFEYPPSEQEMEFFGDSVRQSYRFVDEALGDLLDAWEGKANVIIVSDHGFGRAATFKMEDVDARNKNLSGDHRADGIIMALGPDIQPGQIEGLTIMEIAPTLAALLDVPVAGNLPGRVATELLRPEFLERRPLKSVADYSDITVSNREVSLDHDVQEEEMNTLKGLGYVGEGVEFDVASISGEYDFWAADIKLVTGHIASEIVYFLIQGNIESAQNVLDLLEKHRPDMVARATNVAGHRFNGLMERLPEGVIDPQPFESFFLKNPRKIRCNPLDEQCQEQLSPDN